MRMNSFYRLEQVVQVTCKISDQWRTNIWQAH